MGFATEFYQTNRYGARNGWEASETQRETRSTQPTHCRSPKSVITRRKTTELAENRFSPASRRFSDGDDENGHFASGSMSLLGVRYLPYVSFRVEHHDKSFVRLLGQDVFRRIDQPRLASRLFIDHRLDVVPLGVGYILQLDMVCAAWINQSAVLEESFWFSICHGPQCLFA